MQNLALWIQANTWAYVLILAWDISWRLLAMWHAARQNQKVWFGALLIVNSLGLLPLAYLIFVSKEKFWIKKDTNKSMTEPIQEAIVVKKKKRG